MTILLISNQGLGENIIGNPVMLRMRDALIANSLVENVDYLTCNKPLSVIGKLRGKAKKADVIHIHFGGLYALVVWVLLCGIQTPKMITFHGTDIHAKTIKTTKSWKGKIKIKLNQWASFICIFLFSKVGFVAEDMLTYVPKCLDKQIREKGFIQKLGVDYETFVEMDKEKAQKILGLNPQKIQVLFSDVSGSTIKRRDIAVNIVKELGEKYNLNIMCGVKPNEVPLYINSSDFLLLTSDEEGSPNIIRECLAINKPIFSVEVGDAKTQIDGLNNSAIISRNPKDAASKIKQVMRIPYTDNTRLSKQPVLDLNEITKDVVRIYKELCVKFDIKSRL